MGSLVGNKLQYNKSREEQLEWFVMQMASTEGGEREKLISTWTGQMAHRNTMISSLGAEIAMKWGDRMTERCGHECATEHSLWKCPEALQDRKIPSLRGGLVAEFCTCFLAWPSHCTLCECETGYIYDEDGENVIDIEAVTSCLHCMEECRCRKQTPMVMKDMMPSHSAACIWQILQRREEEFVECNMCQEKRRIGEGLVRCECGSEICCKCGEVVNFAVDETEKSLNSSNQRTGCECV